MAITKEQAIKIATMMLQAATYQTAWIELHPIVTHREGREETYAAIAKALTLMTGANEQELLKLLEGSNGNSSMELHVSEEQVAHLRSEYQNAPVYQNAKGSQYILFNGVYTQDYCYQNIDVARYVDFQPTGKYRNIEKLQKAISHRSDQSYLEALEDDGTLGKLNDEEYSKMSHLYR